MQTIQCFSSMPLLMGRRASGMYTGNTSMELLESVALTMELSALQWRITNGSVTLFTDSNVWDFLQKRGILDSWDYVDTELLDSFYKKRTDIDHSLFWSACKFACYEKIEAPFICVDTDFIAWDKVRVQQDMAFQFAHRELIEDGDENYPGMAGIHFPEHYEDKENAFLLPYASNMSLTYFGDQSFKNYYVAKAISFMENNKRSSISNYAEPEILYMEQRLPLAMAAQRHLRFREIYDIIWSPKRFSIVSSSREFHDWFFSDLNPEKPFTHLWFHKQYLAQNSEANDVYCKKLRELIEKARKKLSC